MFKSLFLSACLIGSFFLIEKSYAESVSLGEKQKIQKLAQEFYLKQSLAEDSVSAFRSLTTDQTRDLRHGCDPDESLAPSCVSILCQKEYCSGSTGKEIAEVCRGSNGRCVQELCKKEYCSGSTGKEIAKACKGVSGLCVEVLCQKEYCSGSTGKEIAAACRGSDGKCVEELCKKEYCSGSTGKEIAKACAGN